MNGSGHVGGDLIDKLCVDAMPITAKTDDGAGVTVETAAYDNSSQLFSLGGAIVLNQQAAIRTDKVAIYIRWSTEDQSDGTTLAVQQEACHHYVISQGWQVNASLVFVDDGHSGGTLDRPRMNALRLAAKAGEVDCVVVYKLDRLSRSVMDTVNLVLGEWDGLTFLKSAREPIDTTSPMGKQFFYMLVSYAEWERSIIRERTMSGKVRRAKEGRYWGGKVPFGYQLSDQRGILELHPENADIVRRIFHRHLQEAGSYEIARELNRDGVPSPLGGLWASPSIRVILKNPVYSGRVRYLKTTVNPRHQRNKTEPWYLTNPNPIEVQSQFPAVISPEEFARVQRLLQARSSVRPGGRTLRSHNLLTGILRCQCGGSMVAHHTGKVPKRYHYYSCKHMTESSGRGCAAGIIAQQSLDQIVEDSLLRLLQSAEASEHHQEIYHLELEAKVKQNLAARKRVCDTLESLSQQAQRVNRDYRSGAMPIVLYEENRRAIDNETETLQAQLADLDGLQRSLALQVDDIGHIGRPVDLDHRWLDLDVLQRKAVLRSLLDTVVAYKEKRSDNLGVHIVWRFIDPTDLNGSQSER